MHIITCDRTSLLQQLSGSLQLRVFTLIDFVSCWTRVCHSYFGSGCRQERTLQNCFSTNRRRICGLFLLADRVVQNSFCADQASPPLTVLFTHSASKTRACIFCHRTEKFRSNCADALAAGFARSQDLMNPSRQGWLATVAVHSLMAAPEEFGLVWFTSRLSGGHALLLLIRSCVCVCIH